MDCPKCVGKLEKRKVENVEIDACPVCEGIWFDAEELEDIIIADSTDSFDYIDVGREEFDGAEVANAGVNLNDKKGKCPRCEDHADLVQAKYKRDEKIKVDMCPKGHGIWLDGGEVQLLRKKGPGYYMKLVRYSFSKEGLKELWANAFK